MGEGQNCLFQKNVDSNKSLSPNRVWVQKNDGSKQVLGPNKCLILKHLVSKKMLRPWKFYVKQDRVVNSSGFKMLLDMVVKLSLTKSECGTAQLTLSLFVLLSCCNRFVVFVELIHLNDLLDDVIFLFSANQKPRKNWHTDDRRTMDRQKMWLIERGCPR